MSTIRGAARWQVVAGVLRNDAGELLLAQRTEGRHMAGMWEFPGGKREPGEDPESALRRELHEELALCVLECRWLVTVPWAYPEHSIELMTFEVLEWQGTPRSCEGQALRWRSLASIQAHTLAPADRPVLATLREKYAGSVAGAP